MGVCVCCCLLGFNIEISNQNKTKKTLLMNFIIFSNEIRS